jgi:hypothetical protein
MHIYSNIKILVRQKVYKKDFFANFWNKKGCRGNGGKILLFEEIPNNLFSGSAVTFNVLRCKKTLFC